MHNRQPKHSLAFNFVFAALFPIILLSFIVLLHLANDSRKETEEQNRLLARTVSSQVASFLHEPLSVLQNISAMIKANPSWDEDTIHQILDLHLRDSEYFESIFMLDEHGIVQNVGLPADRRNFFEDFMHLDMSHMSFYTRAVATRKAAWSDTFLSVMSGEMSLALCVPEDNLSLIGHLNIQALSTFVQNLNTDRQIQISLIDRKGNIIIHPDPLVSETQMNINNLPIIRNGFSGVEETSQFTLNSVEYIGSVEKITEPEWLVLIAQSSRSAYHRVSATALSFVVVALAASLMAILYALLKARKIISPITEAASYAKQIAGGNYTVRFSDPLYEEINELTTSIMEMSDSVQKREIELQMSQKRFREIYNATNEAIFVRNARTLKLIDANQAMVNMFGYSLEELKELAVSELSSGDPKVTLEKARNSINKALQEGPQVLEWNYLRKNGEPFWAEVTLKRAEIDGKERILGVIRNITERKSLERQLVQAQKMEAIGTLAGGIAHDFNNILTPILGYVEIAMLHIDNPHKLNEDLREVLRAVQRAKELVQQILAFSRQESQQLAPTDVAVIIKEALKLLRSSIPTTIEIRQEISPKCGMVMANPTQIHQILMNLCTNAYHAMRESGGVLSVSLSPVEITSTDDPTLKSLFQNNCLELAVRDTGHGMDRNTLSRILEPYFTTKSKEEGTGLGLSVVHGIVKGLGGEIRVESEEGLGTTFHVYLPVIDKISDQIPLTSQEPLPMGQEHILLIDDEEAILRLQTQMLTNLGYHIESFADPEKALEFFAGRTGQCDLIITDMTMPRMTGIVLAEKIRELEPDLPVILCTGFSEAINREKALVMGMDEFLTKPVELHKLARTIRRVLDDRKPDAGRPAN